MDLISSAHSEEYFVTANRCIDKDSLWPKQQKDRLIPIKADPYACSSPTPPHAQTKRTHLIEKLPLVIGGGCGLNCDWNTQWRESGLFESVFVPPCTNDSGIAIGAAIDAQVDIVAGLIPVIGGRYHIGTGVDPGILIVDVQLKIIVYATPGHGCIVGGSSARIHEHFFGGGGIKGDRGSDAQIARAVKNSV